VDGLALEGADWIVAGVEVEASFAIVWSERYDEGF